MTPKHRETGLAVGQKSADNRRSSAGGRVENALSGQRYEKLPYSDNVGSLFVTAAADGLFAELNVGGLSIAPPSVVPGVNRVPLMPDDVLVPEYRGSGGDPVQLTLTNPTGTTRVVWWKLSISPGPNA